MKNEVTAVSSQFWEALKMWMWLLCGIWFMKMQLTAIVYGEEHINPFMVTEVYVKEEGWKLASLAYTKVNY